jgi:hypothetical protein
LLPEHSRFTHPNPTQLQKLEKKCTGAWERSGAPEGGLLDGFFLNKQVPRPKKNAHKKLDFFCQGLFAAHFAKICPWCF